MKTILYLNHTSQISGAEQSLLELLVNLDTARYAPIVASPGDGPLPERLKRMGVPHCPLEFRRLRRTKNPLTLLRTVLSLWPVASEIRRLVEQKGVDLIHCNSTTAMVYAAFPRCLFGRRGPVPLVWHLRDMVDLGWLGRRLSTIADRIITVSEAVRDRVLTGAGAVEWARVVYNGVDIDRFGRAGGSAFRRELGAENTGHYSNGSGEHVVGMIAQFVPWKRHLDFIEAAKRLHTKLPTAKFVLVGADLFGDHPDYCSRLKHAGEELLDDASLIFAGYREDIADVIAGMDVVVLPSEGEPFGRVLIEAGAASVPVVASDDGGAREVVLDGETGLLVAPGDIDGIAEAITKLVSDEDAARKMGRRARRHVERCFTSGRTARETEAVYDELTAVGEGGPE